jgi:hypothetical protein
VEILIASLHADLSIAILDPPAFGSGTVSGKPKAKAAGYPSRRPELLPAYKGPPEKLDEPYIRRARVRNRKPPIVDWSGPVNPSKVFLGALYLRDLQAGEGRSAAPLVWMLLISHARVENGKVICWPSDGKIAERTGLNLRAVGYAIALLIKSGRVTSSVAHKKGCEKAGRLLTLHPLGGGKLPQIKFPKETYMAALWKRAHTMRSRAVATVAAAVAAHVLVLGTLGHGALSSPVTAPVQTAAILGITGVKSGGAFTTRLRDLERAGVLSKDGGKVTMLPITRGMPVSAKAKATAGRRPKSKPWPEAMPVMPAEHSQNGDGNTNRDDWIDAQVHECVVT